jgi:hypothetical protein
MTMHRTPILLALALACTACTQSPPPDPARRATIPSPDAAPGTAGNMASVADPDRHRYACDNGGTVYVEYVAETARVELPDGRVVALPKAQSASKGGGDVFVGEAMSLQRDGGGIQLHQDEGKPLLCQASAKTE